MSESQHPPSSRSIGFAGAIGLAVLLAAVTYLLIQIAFDLPHRNEFGLRGGLAIATNPEVEIYIGNKPVGNGAASLTWDDLLGTPERRPLAMTIRSDAPSPTMEGMGGVTAEAVAGPGSEIVWKRDGMAGSVRNLEPFAFAWKRVVIERPGGELDHVAVLDAEFPMRTGKWRRFLVPIRFGPVGERAPYFSDVPSGGVSSVKPGILPAILHGTRIGSSLWLTFRTDYEAPPEELAEAIGESGLWTPTRIAEE